MALNPIPAAIIGVVGYMMQVLMLASGAFGFNYPDITVSGGGGFFDKILGPVDEIVKVAGDAAIFLYQFLTFKYVEMPFWFGVPLFLGITGTITWSIFELARGT